MRKVTLTLAIALLFAGSAVLTADAQTSRGAAQNFTPIEPAACRGWGPYCRLDSSACAVGFDAGVVPAGK